MRSNNSNALQVDVVQLKLLQALFERPLNVTGLARRCRYLGGDEKLTTVNTSLLDSLTKLGLVLVCCKLVSNYIGGAIAEN